MTERVFDLPQPSQARSAATQERFVEAAIHLLATRHWADISIEDLVAEADLSVGAFYKRFGVKDDLLAACIERVLAEGRLQAEVLFAVDGDLATRVDALVEILSVGWREHAHVVRAAISMGDPRHMEALTAESARTQARITEWLLARRDEFTHPDPEAAVSNVFVLQLAALQHALVTIIAPADQARLVRETAAMIRAYLAGS